jgi:hypothetical protein
MASVIEAERKIATPQIRRLAMTVGEIILPSC